MRVLQIGKFYPPHKGGIESHFELLCNGLAQNINVEALAFSDGRDCKELKTQSGTVYLSGVDCTIAGCPISTGLINTVRRLSATADVVHLHHPNPMGSLALLMSGYRGPLVVTYHSDVVRQRVTAMALGPMFEALWKRTTAFIVQSPNYIDSSTTLSKHRRRCHVIPSAIDTACYRQLRDAERSSIRAQHGDRIVLAVGRMVSYKGYEYLIRAMESVSATLLCIGVGPLRANLERLATDLDIDSKVRFLGSVPDVTAYYQACDVFVMPSITRAEAFGLAQVEAMACGKPVINTDLPSGVPFVSRHGESGLTVRPMDSEALASAINLLLEDEALRHRLGSAARYRAEADFDVTQMVNRTLSLYELVASQRRDRGMATVVRNSTRPQEQNAA